MSLRIYFYFYELLKAVICFLKGPNKGHPEIARVRVHTHDMLA